MLQSYVACHVPLPPLNLSYTAQIQTGAGSKQHWDNFLHDDSGDNITGKNRYFGEHTGLYWVWKNTQVEAVGWCHYRRYFSPVLFPESQYMVEVTRDSAQTILSVDPAGTIFNYELAFSDIILPRHIQLGGSIAAQYCRFHRQEDWLEMMRALYDFYPDEAPAIQKFFDTQASIHPACLFMTKRPHFEAFCEWLFPFLFHLEMRIVPSEDDYQCRVFSYQAERLFNWWVASRGLQVVYRPHLMIA